MSYEFSCDGGLNYEQIRSIELITNDATHIRLLNGSNVFVCPKLTALKWIFSPHLKTLQVDSNDLLGVANQQGVVIKDFETIVFNCAANSFRCNFKNTKNIVVMCHVHENVIKAINACTAKSVFIGGDVPNEDIRQITKLVHLLEPGYAIFASNDKLGVRGSAQISKQCQHLMKELSIGQYTTTELYYKEKVDELEKTYEQAIEIVAQNKIIKQKQLEADDLQKRTSQQLEEEKKQRIEFQVTLEQVYFIVDESTKLRHQIEQTFIKAQSENDELVKALKSEVAATNHKIAELECENSNLKQNVTDLKTELQNVQTELQQKQEALNDSEQQKSTIAQLKDKIAELETVKTVLNPESRDLQVKCQQLEQQVQQHQMDLLKMQNQHYAELARMSGKLCETYERVGTMTATTVK